VRSAIVGGSMKRKYTTRKRLRKLTGDEVMVGFINGLEGEIKNLILKEWLGRILKVVKEVDGKEGINVQEVKTPIAHEGDGTCLVQPSRS